MTHDALAPAGGWHTKATPRMLPPGPEARSLLFRAVSRFSGVFGRGHVPDVFTLMNRNPRLFWAWLFFASRLMPWGKLSASTREMIILRTAWNCRSRYEWGQHVDIALRTGVTDDDIIAISRGPDAFADDVSRALMSACDEMITDKCISDATWKTLSARYTEKLLIEIMILIGHYEMLAGLLNSSGLPLEPDTETTLQAFYQRIRP